MTGHGNFTDATHALGQDSQWEKRRDWILSFDGVIWLYKGGYAAKMEVRLLPSGPSVGQPEGFEYCFTFHEPGIDGGLGKRIYGFDNSHSPDKKPPNDHEHKTVWPKCPPGARPRESIGRRVDELSRSKAFDLFPKRVDEILKMLNLPVEVVGQKRTADAKVELRDVRSAKKS